MQHHVVFAEVFPHRKWPEKVHWAMLVMLICENTCGTNFRIDLVKLTRAYASFWMYLGTDDPNNVTLDEFTVYSYPIQAPLEKRA